LRPGRVNPRHRRRPSCRFCGEASPAIGRHR
jgi:hypothetical protein